MRLTPKLKAGIIVVFLLLFLAIFNLLSVSKGIKNFFYLISSPIQKIFWGAGDSISDFFAAISEIKKLKKENEELKLKIQEISAENIFLKELKKENEILREALNLDPEKEWTLVIGRVIGKEISQDSLIINQGLNDGISKDLPVITEQKVLVGKIGEVYADFSKIQLISHPSASFDAKIIDAEIFGLIKGKGNLKLSLDFIPREEEIKVRDGVITAALGGNFPAGLLVGEIEEIKKSDVTPFQTAEIKPAFDIKNLDFLFIITNFKSFEN